MIKFLVDHWFAFSLLGIYTAILLWHARYGYKSSGNISGFLVGGRKLGGVVIGVSFVATFASTNSYLGLAGKSYEYGAPWLLFAVLIVAFTYLSWRFVAPGLRRFTALTDTVTVPEFLAVRYSNKNVRVGAGVIIAISSMFYLIAIFKGAGNLFQIFLDIPYEAAVLIMLVVVLFYTSVGGFLSVVRTDVLQGILMLIGSLLLFYFITQATGGVGSIFELLENKEKAWLFEWDAGIPFVVLLGISLAGAMKLLIDPRQISRFYGLKDDGSVQSGILYAVFGLLVIQFSLFPLGLYAHHLLDDVTDTDLIVPTLVQNVDIFPVLVADFLVVAILSAAMSSMDSVLLVVGSVTTRDVVGPYVQLSEEQHVIWTRVGIVVCAVLAAGIALNPIAGIVELTIFSGSLYAACFAPAILLGLHWRKGNALSALLSFVTGISVLLIWRGLGLHTSIHEVLPALVLSFTVYVVLAHIVADTQNHAIDEYFSANSSHKFAAIDDANQRD